MLHITYIISLSSNHRAHLRQSKPLHLTPAFTLLCPSPSLPPVSSPHPPCCVVHAPAPTLCPSSPSLPISTLCVLYIPRFHQSARPISTLAALSIHILTPPFPSVVHTPGNIKPTSFTLQNRPNSHTYIISSLDDQCCQTLG